MGSEGTAANYGRLDLWLIDNGYSKNSKEYKKNPNIMFQKKILSSPKKKKKNPWFWSGSLEHKCTQGGPGRKNQ